MKYKDEFGSNEIQNHLASCLNEMGDFCVVPSHIIEEARKEYSLNRRHRIILSELRNYDSEGGVYDKIFGMYPQLIISPDGGIDNCNLLEGEEALTSKLRLYFLNKLNKRQKNPMMRLNYEGIRVDLLLKLKRDKKSIDYALSIIPPYETFVDNQENRTRAISYFERKGSLEKEIESLEKRIEDEEKTFSEFTDIRISWNHHYKREGLYPIDI